MPCRTRRRLSEDRHGPLLLAHTHRAPAGQALLPRAFRQGQESEAEKHAKAAVLSDPTIASAHELWGALALNRGDFGTAIRELQSALKLNPTFPKAEYELGLALYSKGDPQSAIPHLQQAAKLDSPEAAQFLKKITK